MNTPLVRPQLLKPKGIIGNPTDAHFAQAPAIRHRVIIFNGEVHQELSKLLMYQQNAKEFKQLGWPVEKLGHFLLHVEEQSYELEGVIELCAPNV